MKTFKSLIFLMLLSFVTTLLGCDKMEDPNTDTIHDESFLTCKINGELRKFNYAVNANDKPATEVEHFVVIGGWEKEDMNIGFGISLLIPEKEGVKETTYSVAGTNTLELDADYYIQNWNGGKHTGTTVYSGGRSDGTNFTLTITSLTKWGVKGTFSGRLQNGSAYVVVTDGKFSAPYN